MSSRPTPTNWNNALAGKAAIVTGAASGIGRATAATYARAGADVLLVDRDAAGLEQTLASITDAETDVTSLTIDLTDFADLDGVVAAAMERFGRLDILNNTAGISEPVMFETVDQDAFDRIVGTNLKAVFFLCRAAAPHLVADGGGCIVSVASIAGVIGVAQASAYAASKAGVIGLTRALAVELTPRGVRVNAICPGFIDTPMTRPYFDAIEDPQERAAAMDATVQSLLIRRAGRPEELADTAVFLASDAASYITGAIVPVDGGWSVW